MKLPNLYNMKYKDELNIIVEISDNRVAARDLVLPDVLIMIGAVTRNLLRPTSLTLTQVAGRKRGPPRFLGKTKAQYLDWLMRSNANICALISFSFFPIVAGYTYRYITVLKPARDAKAAEEEEALLAEGKATA